MMVRVFFVCVYVYKTLPLQSINNLGIGILLYFLSCYEPWLCFQIPYNLHRGVVIYITNI